MQARVLHRVHIARGLSQAVSCLVLFPCVASEICELFILAMVCANFIDVGAVFDIKVVGFLVSAVDYQASVEVSLLQNGPFIVWTPKIHRRCSKCDVEVRD